jgi:hypothetical protein
MRSGRALLLLVAPLGLLACTAITGVFGTVSGDTLTASDNSCDRRVAPKPEPFCQEIVGTLVGAQFQEDCVSRFSAKAEAALCPRESVIGGCRVDKVFDDGSRVTDWFYDLSQLDGGTDAFAPPARHLTVAEVQALCSDRTRYEDGAHFVMP